MSMNDEPLPALDDADDRITRYRAAAFGILHGHAFGAEQRDDSAGTGFGAIVLDLIQLGQLAGDDHVQATPKPDVSENLLAGFGSGFLQHAFPTQIRDVLQFEAERTQRLSEQAFAELGRFLQMHGLQRMTYLAARLAGDDIT